MKKTPTLFLAALALLTACSESPEAKVKREAAELAALKKKMTVVAQAAADQRMVDIAAQALRRRRLGLDPRHRGRLVPRPAHRRRRRDRAAAT